jgi:uncharacterized SAM-binding protein YcdF (DUF218 family)
MKKCLGLFTRRERWGLSRRGWLVFFTAALVVALAWAWNVQPFLAPTQRVPAKILVMEGWVGQYVARAAAREFVDGHYDFICTTGGLVTGSEVTNIYNTIASVGAGRLIGEGVPADKVHIVPADKVGRDRTYTSAQALRAWFQEQKISVTEFNLITEDVHARRSWLLFQRAFGGSVKVGIVAVPDPDYEPAHWWYYSEGVREILGESIAYVYAKFLFSPGT